MTQVAEVVDRDTAAVDRGITGLRGSNASVRLVRLLVKRRTQASRIWGRGYGLTGEPMCHDYFASIQLLP